MKKVLSVFIIIFLFCNGEAQTKIFRNSDVKLEYPKNWKTSKFNGYVMFTSKDLKNTDYIGPNPVYVYPNKLVYPKGLYKNDIEILDAHASRSE